jgi:hypothetical protein
MLYGTMPAQVKLSRVTALVIALLIPFAANAAETANPIGDFFKRLGRSIANAGKREPAGRTPARKTKRTAGRPATGPEQGAAAAVPTPTPEPSVTPTPMSAPRASAVITDANTRKRDLPYAIPVPNRPGFVTSPFAPNAGVVDVRGIPSGTEVKDPYTGRSFLTP